MRASWSGHESVVRLLLSRGAKQEFQSDRGNTALHAAVSNDQPAIVALLCGASGAALALKTIAEYGSRTPLALAIHFSRAACKAVLRAHGAS
jgi:ankyrin repeat protein